MHLGVCAESCELSLVDRIFTRIGASDKIMEGQSTFFVELSEAATILKYSTRDSLVILDELGRGTSTFDGSAIAQAVVEKLIDTKCLTMFATHYHSLVREVGKSPHVSLGHMVCVPSDEQGGFVTFLYKLEKGASDKSYGLNVARLAKLPDRIVDRAAYMSSVFQKAYVKHVQWNLLSEIQKLAKENKVEEIKRVMNARFHHAEDMI